MIYTTANPLQLIAGLLSVPSKDREGLP